MKNPAGPNFYGYSNWQALFLLGLFMLPWVAKDVHWQISTPHQETIARTLHQLAADHPGCWQADSNDGHDCPICHFNYTEFQPEIPAIALCSTPQLLWGKPSNYVIAWHSVQIASLRLRGPPAGV